MATTQVELEPLLSTTEVATWLGVNRSTLCKWRQAATGPRVVWVTEHTPRYRRGDVVDWLESREAGRSA